MKSIIDLLPSVRALLGIAFTFSALFLPHNVISQSLLWKITGNDLTSPSYLYGTIHLKDQRIFEWKDSVYSRIDRCNAYAGELDLKMDNLIKASGFMLLPKGQTLHDRFTAAEYEMIQKAFRLCSGYELALFDQLKPVALVALCFSGNNAADLEATVDELLYQKAVTSGKKITGLETVEEQGVLIDKIPDSYVIDYFSNLDGQADEFEKLIRCYRNADLDSIWLLMQDEVSGSLLNNELIRVRNYRMTERIVPLIREQSTFIAIGSGHLPGKEGVIALLRKEGFVVEAEVISISPTHPKPSSP